MTISNRSLEIVNAVRCNRLFDDPVDKMAFATIYFNSLPCDIFPVVPNIALSSFVSTVTRIDAKVTPQMYFVSYIKHSRFKEEFHSSTAPD